MGTWKNFIKINEASENNAVDLALDEEYIKNIRKIPENIDWLMEIK